MIYSYSILHLKGISSLTHITPLMNSPQLKILQLHKDIHKTFIRLAHALIYHTACQLFVRSFKTTQLYASYTLVLVFCISNNFQICIMSRYTASTNWLYCIYIYNGGKQLLQLLWNTFLHMHYGMFHVLWLGSRNKL
jgi:hypothetical protein